jgi:hypothetical protein
MTDHDERELAELLRRALHAEAARHVPTGAGLRRIQERVRAKQRFGWARPVLVMGAVAAVATAAAVLPAALRQATRSNTPDTAAGGPAQLSTASLVVPRSTASQAAPTLTLPPGAGVSDMPTVWPYGSRAQGYYRAPTDVKSRHPELIDPARTALSFVHRYVGNRVKLVTGPSTKTPGGVSVVVSRVLEDGTRHAVTRVLLVPVSLASAAPYLVAAAERPSLPAVEPRDPARLTALTVLTPGPLDTAANRIRVTGSLIRPLDRGMPKVKVELCDAAGTSLSFNQTIATLSPDKASYTWVTQISVDPDQVGDAASIAAWTLDDNSDVLEFVALPAPLVYVPGTDPSAIPTPTTTAPVPSAVPASGAPGTDH